MKSFYLDQLLPLISSSALMTLFLDYTTQDFFERNGHLLFPGAQVQITKTCLTYLSLDLSTSDYLSSNEDSENRLSDELSENGLQQNAFFTYAARNWGKHAGGDTQQEVCDLAARFLMDDSKAASMARAWLGPYHAYPNYSSNRVYEIPIVPYFDLGDIGIAMLQEGIRLDLEDIDGRTPLPWGAGEGNLSVVRLLIKNSADVESKDNIGQTPLSWAAREGHRAVVKLLSENGANVESKDSFGQTPLSWAAKEGHKAIVRFLIENGANVEPKSSCWYLASRPATSDG